MKYGLPMMLSLVTVGLGGNSVHATGSLLYFDSHHSVLCAEVREDVLTDQRVRERIEKLKFEQIDVDTHEGMSRAIQADVPWSPTFVLLDDQKELRRAERIHTASDLLALLDGKQIAQVGGAAGPGSSSAEAPMECAEDQPNDAPSGDLDILRVCGSVGPKLRVRIDISDPPTVQSSTRFNVFIDSDDNEDTGYATATFKGADYVIQGGFLYKFSGSSPTEWKFDQVCAVTVEVKVTSLRFSVPMSSIKAQGAELRLWVGSQTANWQPADWAPEGSPLLISNKTGVGGSSSGLPSTESEKIASTPSPAPNAPSHGQKEEKPEASVSPNDQKQSDSSLSGSNVCVLSDPQGDAAEPGLDLTKAEIAQTADKLMIRLTAAGIPSLNSLHIFIDADADEATGYSDGTRSGADFMLEGATLHKHQKNVGTAWGWDQLGALTPPPQVSGKSVTYSLPKSRIGLAEGKKIRLWFATTDAKWNTADILPDGVPATYPEK